MNKKYIFIAILLLSPVCSLQSPVSHAADATLFQQANDKYKSGDFKAASDLYTKLTQTGNGSADVYYNLGNSVLRLGQKGQALVYYERALKADPRDKDIRWNIQVLKTSFVDRIEDTSTQILYMPVKNVLDHVTSDEFAIAFSTVLALFALTVVLGALFPNAKALFGPLRSATLLILLITGVLFALKWWDTKDPRAVILEKEVTGRYGPSDSESKALVLHEGAVGKIVDESGDWIYIQLANKNMGWLRKSSCEII